MNPWRFPCTCSVCGGEGVAQEPGLDWLSEVRHQNPEVCAMYLREKRRRLEKLQQELAEKKEQHEQQKG